jgi:hypothetical protein
MKKSLITTTFCLTLITFSSFIKAAPVLIDFDDVIGSRVDSASNYQITVLYQ